MAIPELDLSEFGGANNAPVADLDLSEFEAPKPKKGGIIGDLVKQGAAGALQGAGMIFQGGADVIARGVNAAGEAIGHNPELRAENPFSSDVIGNPIQSLQQSVSDQGRQAMEDSTPSGDIGDPSTWSLGKNPSVGGYARHAANVVGQFAPNLGVAMATAGASVPQQLAIGAGVGGLQGYGGGVQGERDAFNAMTHEELLTASKDYQDLIAGGMGQSQAKNIIVDKAAVGGGIGVGIPSSLEGAAENVLIGALTKGKVKVPALFGKGPLGKAATGILGGSVTGAIEEGGEQATQNIGSNLAIGGTRDISQGVFEQGVLGALGEGIVGGAGGAASHFVKSEQAQPAPQPEVPPTAPPAAQEQIQEPAAVDMPAWQAADGAYGVRQPVNAQAGVPFTAANIGANLPQKPAGPLARAAAKVQPPTLGLPERDLDPLISFPDGSVGRQSDADAYINSLPESQRIAARAQLFGYATEAINDAPTPLSSAVAQEPAVATGDNGVGGVANLPDLAAGPGSDNPAAAPAPSSDSHQPDGDGNRGDDAVAAKVGDIVDMGGAQFRKTANGFERVEPAATIDEAAHAAATSPNNDIPQPTDAQKKAGNYAKGHTRIGGLDVSIENPQGSVRSGTDPNGKPWSNTLQSHYGYIKGTIGKDGDHVDTFIKPGTAEDFAGTAFVIDQKKGNGHFDEHKIMLGFDTLEEAKAAYQANYSKDWDGIRDITPMPMEQFKDWIATGDHTQPAAKVDPNTTAEQTANAFTQSAPSAVTQFETNAPNVDNIQPQGLKPSAVSTNPQNVDTSAERVQETPESIQAESDSTLRPLVEAIAKRRAVAEGQLGKSKQYARVLDAAKKMMAGEPVQIGRLRIDANELKGDKELHASAMKLVEIASQPARQAKATRVQAVESYRTRIAEAKTKESLQALAGEIQNDATLTDVQAQDLDDAVFEAMDAVEDGGGPEESNAPLAEAKASPDTFVQSPDGSVDFGEITAEQALAMRRQSGKIRLNHGIQNNDGSGYGLAHIEARHGKQIRSAGFKSIEEFVLDAVRHIDSIWSPGKTTQIVAIQSDDKGKVMFLELQPAKDEAGDYYRVNSAFPASGGYSSEKEVKEGWKSLWSRYPVPADASGASDFVGKAPEAGGAAPMVKSQSGEESVRQPSAENKSAQEPKPAAASTSEAIAAEAEAIEPAIPEAPTESIGNKQRLQAVNQEAKIGDFGRKVEVRKDVAQPTGPRGKKLNSDERPAWMRKYHIFQIKEIGGLLNQRNVGKWQIMEESPKLKGAVAPAFRQVFDTEQEAIVSLPLLVVAKKHRAYSYEAETPDGKRQLWGVYRNITDRKRVMIEGGFATYKDAMEAMATNPTKYIEHKFDFPERPWLDRIERIGAARRTKDVTKQMFIDTFAPGGVVYGNWLLNKDDTVNAEGQALSNHAYDALMDLADAINVPPKALFLNGDMVLALGADGKGGEGSAAAHYSPGKVLINLTKINGAGSAAHEWWHAVDHYFARNGGYKDSPSVVAGGFARNSTARPELMQAIKQVVDAMSYAEKSTTTDADVVRNRAQKRIDDAVKSLDYQLNDLRRTMTDTQYRNKKTIATAAQLKQWDAMAERLRNGDQGEKVYIEPSAQASRYSKMAMGFESGEVIRDMNVMFKSVTGRGFLKSDQSSVGRQMKWPVETIRDNKAKLNVKEDVTTTSKGRTDYYLEAKHIDEYRVSDYWSTPEEMGARAFESYIFDKLISEEKRSDYLVYGVENRYYAAMDMRPYPEGAERTAINGAFDGLFKAIQTKETDKGVALFSRSAMKSVDANVLRGRKAMNQTLLDRADVTRAMYHNELGWIDFVWGDGVRGIQHIINQRVRKDGMPVSDVYRLLTQEIVDAIATGTIIRNREISGAVRLVVGDGQKEAVLVKNPGGNGWVLNGWKVKTPDAIKKANDFKKATPDAADSSDGKRVAGVVKELSALAQRNVNEPDTAMSRGAGTGMPHAAVQSTIDAIRAKWNNAPEVVVVDDMNDPRIREDVRDENQRQLSQGATGQPEGFFDDGKVYIVASEMNSPKDVVRVLLHESLGHFGLRGVFGKDLDGILDQLYMLRRPLVLAKANQYGLDITKQSDRRLAAEEVLAEMAQTNPQIGFVQRAIAAIRTWLREHGFTVELTDAEIIRSILEPARNFVQRGNGSSSINVETGANPFSRPNLTTINGKAPREGWFASTKVSANGKPMVLYRGASTSLREQHFSNDAYGKNSGHLSSSLGVWFTTSPDEAGRYGRAEKFAIDMRNPRVIKAEDLPSFEDAKDVIKYRENIKQQGHDGIVIDARHLGGQRHFIAFTPEQVIASEKRAMFSRSAIIDDSGRFYTDEQRAMFGNVGREVEIPNIKERLAELRKDMGKKMAQGLVDQFAPIKDIDKDAYGLMRLAKGASAAFEVFMQAGRLKLTDNVYDYDEANKGGVIDRLLVPLQNESGDFMWWVASNRADALRKEHVAAQAKADTLQADAKAVASRADALEQQAKDQLQQAGNFPKAMTGNQRAQRQNARDANSLLAEAKGLRSQAADMRRQATELRGINRERLFKDEDIAAGKSLADGETAYDYTLQHDAPGHRAGTVTRNRRLVYQDSLKTFNQFHRNALDMAEQSGLIDPESRAIWEKEFYIPFYRVDDEEGFRGMNVKSGAVRQEAFKQLKGGTQKLNSDLLENTLMNWAHLLDASAKNRAAKASIDAAQKIGIAEEVPAGTKNAVWVQDGGNKKHYTINDPYVLTALTSLEYAGLRGGVMDALSATKHWLTIGVTASPFFKVRNLIRDSIQAIGTSGLSYNPVKNISEGFKGTKKGDEYFHMLAGGGLIRFGSMLEGSEANRTRALVEKGVDPSTILNNESALKQFYKRRLEPLIEAYNELGNRGEEINRVALYQQLRKQGLSHAEASLEARDLMDFSMQGSWTAVRFLTQVVPFMNARFQGLYKLGRGAKNDPAKFATVVGAATMISLALLSAYGDDDDWKQREDWDRDNYWWLKIGGVAYRIPKPFEIGAIATLAERSAELMFDDEMNGERFAKSVKELLFNQLAMNPVPQMFKPVIDLYANNDSFTGRPIESMGMERLAPEYRFKQSTSMVARGVSTAGNAIAQPLGMDFVSPVQVDHLVRGYFSWLGAFVVGGADMAIRSMSDEPARPSKDMWKFATGGIVSDVDSAQSRYVSKMYDQAKELEEAYGTYRNLLKQGKTDEAIEYRADNQDKLRLYRSVESVKRKMTALNERARMIERSNLGADEKKAKIDLIRQQQNEVAKALSMRTAR